MKKQKYLTEIIQKELGYPHANLISINKVIDFAEFAGDTNYRNESISSQETFRMIIGLGVNDKITRILPDLRKEESFFETIDCELFYLNKGDYLQDTDEITVIVYSSAHYNIANKEVFNAICEAYVFSYAQYKEYAKNLQVIS